MTVIMFERLCLFLVQKFDGVIGALEQGLPVDLSGLPPSPSQSKKPDLFVFYISRKTLFVELV